MHISPFAASGRLCFVVLVLPGYIHLYCCVDSITHPLLLASEVIGTPYICNTGPLCRFLLPYKSFLIYHILNVVSGNIGMYWNVCILLLLIYKIHKSRNVRKCILGHHTSRNVRKRTFGHMRPAKIQIRLRIRAGWSESSRGAVWISKDAKMLHVDNEDWLDCEDVQADLSLRKAQ